MGGASSVEADHQIGEQIAGVIAERGADPITPAALSGLVRDLLAGDTTLQAPLQDLLLRPEFRMLLTVHDPAPRQAGRDALLTDLSEVYQPAALIRLAAILDGCLGLPAGPLPVSLQFQPATAASPPQDFGPTLSPVAQSWSPAGSPDPRGYTAPQGQPLSHLISAQQPSSSPANAVLITLLSMVAGGAVMAIGWSVISQRQTIPWVASSGSSTSNAPADDGGLWQACRTQDPRSIAPPLPGETWWPVVGPAAALDVARRRCRADAFINLSGNMQIASFRDRAVAERFARDLSEDSRHSYNFWLGEPSQH